ncbi:hypothetical protein EDD33_0872 [Nocardioides aurantiacus]|uniref:Uncharacterized protein n=1 Tax=Nocardioides aurantiacus TaxID=86796 RepID=A0A3N2CR69_9ACTN|nr:hypothetical protein EDD33_0872 [Nocardioides aurantiacus]
MSVIWATRGRTWGFRFLRDGGFADPLPVYEAAFAGIGAGPSAIQRVGATVAVRLPDPYGRRDAAGRSIPHEFVVSAPLAEQVETVEDALRILWPQVADDYDKVWDSEPV